MQNQLDFMGFNTHFPFSSPFTFDFPYPGVCSPKKNTPLKYITNDETINIIKYLIYYE